MECQVKVVNMGKTNGRYYEVHNLGQAKLIALMNLRKFGGVAIIKARGLGRRHYVLGSDGRLVEVSEKSGQEFIDLIENEVDSFVYVPETTVEYVEKFYSVPTEPGTILFTVDGTGKKPSLWEKVVKAVKSWF